MFSQGCSSVELSCEATAASYDELQFNYACWRVARYIRQNAYTGYSNFLERSHLVPVKGDFLLKEKPSGL
jgi:hypothetical protein